MNTENITDWTVVATMEPQLNARERALRDMFVVEYLKDYNYTAAAVRIGFGDMLAIEYGQRFKYDPYVQRKIAQFGDMQPEDPENRQKVLQQRVQSQLWREANANGPGASHSARVSALAKLTNILGMETATKTEAKVTHEGSQQLNLTHDFQFDNLDTEELTMVRKLLEKQVEKIDGAASTSHSPS